MCGTFGVSSLLFGWSATTWRIITWTVALCSFAMAGTLQLPAGKILEIRLTHSLASFSSQEWSGVEGVIIAPVFDQGRVLIPMGAKVAGVVRESRRVGLGFVHETARLSIDFSRLTLPDGSSVALDTRVIELDNARESVDREGRIKGIRSTGTIGYRANNLIAGFAMFDPIAYAYVNVASARMLRFSEPEIWLPAGTELSVRLLSPVELTGSYELPFAAIQASQEERAALRSLVRSLPYRTMTANSNKPSDVTNLVFLGSPAALERAFRAAGWVQSDRLNTISGFLTLRSIAEDQRYHSAPMSVLLLDEQRPIFTFSKSLNTFSKRHHLRIWLRSEKWQGRPVLTASATQDIGIALSRKNKTFIHLIDTEIDRERDKILNDLVFTGCVDAAELQRRPWLPTDAHNATGEPLMTDRRVAVLEMNACMHPKSPVDLQAPPDIPATGAPVERGFRQGILITRNDIYRGNLIYQGYEGAKYGVRYLRHKNGPDKTMAGNSGARGGATPSAAEVETAEAELDKTPPPRPDAAVPGNVPESLRSQSEEEKPPLFELGFEGGWLRFGNTLDVTSISLQPKTPQFTPISLVFQNRLHNGWAIGTHVTLNSWRYFSNEFSFDYQRGQYRLAALFSGLPTGEPSGYQEETTGLLTNQFGYAVVANLRSRGRRFRPYVAAGPAFQLLHVTDAPFKSSGGVFKVGLRNVGLILAAYNFANTPPLDGGGVFQFGFQYGGGVKYRFSRKWLVRLDYRETLSPQPNFVGRSIHIDDPSDSDEYIVYKESNQPAGPLRQGRLTAGFSFVF
jgi:opacity protein-like surface antigen